MPRHDRTGPMGDGPMTGKGAGLCAGRGRGRMQGRSQGRFQGGRQRRRGMMCWDVEAELSSADQRALLEAEKTRLQAQIKLLDERLRASDES